MDLVFVIDRTGSMGSYTNTVRKMVDTIIKQVVRLLPGTDVRIGIVCFGDVEKNSKDTKGKGVFAITPFTTNTNTARKGIIEGTLSYGGDGPEFAMGGLYEAYKLDWKSASRVAILVTDAPGHGFGGGGDNFPKGLPKYLLPNTPQEILDMYQDAFIDLYFCQCSSGTKHFEDRLSAMYDRVSEARQQERKMVRVPLTSNELDLVRGIVDGIVDAAHNPAPVLPKPGSAESKEEMPENPTAAVQVTLDGKQDAPEPQHVQSALGAIKKWRDAVEKKLWMGQGGSAATGASSGDVQQLDTFLEKVRSSGKLHRVVPVLDLSGSMAGTALEMTLAVALAASRSYPEFKERLVPMSQGLQDLQLTGKSASQVIDELCNVAWSTILDVQKLLAMLLKWQKREKIAADKTPQVVLVLTSAKERKLTHASFDAMNALFLAYHTAGYGSPPLIVVWNLAAAGRSSAPFETQADDRGIVFLEGNQPAFVDYIINGGLDTLKSGYSASIAQMEALRLQQSLGLQDEADAKAIALAVSRRVDQLSKLVRASGSIIPQTSQKVSDLDARMVRIQKTLDLHRSRLDKTETKASSPSVSPTLQRDFDALKSANTSLKNDVSQLRSENTGLKQKLGAVEKTVTQLKGAQESMQATMKRLTDDLEDRVVKEMMAKFAQHKDVVTSMVAASDKRTDAAEQKLLHTSATLDSIKDMHDSMAGDITSLNQQLQKTVESSEQKVMSFVTMHLDKLGSDAEEEEKKATAEKLLQSVQEMDDMREKLQTATSSLDNIRKEVRLLKDVDSNTKKEVKKYMDQAVDNMNSALEKEAKKNAIPPVVDLSEVDELKKALADKNANEQVLQAHLDKLFDRVVHLETKHDETKTHLATVSYTVSCLRTDVANTAENMADMFDVVDDIATNNVELAREVEEAKRQAEVSVKEYEACLETKEMHAAISEDPKLSVFFTELRKMLSQGLSAFFMLESGAVSASEKTSDKVWGFLKDQLPFGAIATTVVSGVASLVKRQLNKNKSDLRGVIMDVCWSLPDISKLADLSSALIAVAYKPCIVKSKGQPKKLAQVALARIVHFIHAKMSAKEAPWGKVSNLQNLGRAILWSVANVDLQSRLESAAKDFLSKSSSDFFYRSGLKTPSGHYCNVKYHKASVPDREGNEEDMEYFTVYQSYVRYSTAADSALSAKARAKSHHRKSSLVEQSPQQQRRRGRSIGRRPATASTPTSMSKRELTIKRKLKRLKGKIKKGDKILSSQMIPLLSSAQLTEWLKSHTWITAGPSNSSKEADGKELEEAMASVKDLKKWLTSKGYTVIPGSAVSVSMVKQKLRLPFDDSILARAKSSQ